MTLPARVSFTAGLSALYLAVAAILLIVCWQVWQSQNQYTLDNEWVSHTYKVQGQVQAVIARLGTLQTDAIGYATSGDEARRARLDTQLPQIEKDLAALRELVRDNPTQAERTKALSAGIMHQSELARQLVEQRHATGKLPESLPTIGMSGMREIAGLMLDEEDGLLLQRRLNTEKTATLTRQLTLAAIVLGLLFLAATYWLVLAAHRRSAKARADLRAANAKLSQALDSATLIGESMTKLSHFGEMLQSCRSIDEVRAGLGAALADMLPALGGRLALINPSQNLAANAVHWGIHGLDAESIFAPEDCWALRRGQAYPLAGTNAGFVCKHMHWPNPDQPNAGYLCIPLAAHGEMIGVLTFDAERPPDASERRVAMSAGEQVALAIANLRLQETLRTQSVRDPLTGLFNRRYLEVSLEREVMRAARRNQPLSVLMLDVDHFKRFNDTYGHEAGDALLAQFAEVLMSSVRAEDIVCRYGGEEFTVVLLEADAPTTQRIAEGIRSRVAEMSVAYRQQQLEHVTVSIGSAMFPLDATKREDLLRRADAALYAAKKAGRNRVSAANAHTAPTSD